MVNLQSYAINFLSTETNQLKAIIKNNTLPQIIKTEITNEIIVPVQCSADRSGYLIYQDN